MIKMISNETQLTNLTLEEAQKFVGGYVQLIKLANGQKMLFDEEARIKTPRPKVNIEASKILQDNNSAPTLKVLGNAIIIEKNVKNGGW